MDGQKSDHLSDGDAQAVYDCADYGVAEEGAKGTAKAQRILTALPLS